MTSIPSLNHNPQPNKDNTNSKILLLQQLLANNRNTRKKLTCILTSIQHRMEELEEAGVETCKNNTSNFTKLQIFNSHQHRPKSLLDQMYIKMTPFKQISFARDIGQKMTKAQEVDMKKLDRDVRGIDFVTQGQAILQKYDHPIEAYQRWFKIHKKKTQKKKQKKVINLQEIEKEQFRQRKSLYGQNWEKLGFYYNGLQFSEIYKLYHEELCNRDLGKWSYRHNIMMIVLVEYFGKGKWAAVSRFIKIKSEFQCRERFCNILDPTIRENVWTEEDENVLLEVAKQHNYKWSTIVKKVERFSTKTDNALRRKFRNLVMKKDNNEIDSIVAKPNLANSIKEFKSKYYNRRKKNNDINSE